MIFSFPYNFYAKAIAWSITIICSIIIGLKFLQMSKQQKEKNESVARIRKGYSIFFIAWAISRLLFLFADYVEGTQGDNVLYAQFLLIAYLLTMWAIIFLIYSIEAKMSAKPKLKLTKYSMVIGVIIVIFYIVSIFYPQITLYARYFTYISTSVIGFAIFIFYLVLAARSTGETRKITLLNLLGICLIFAGHIMDADLIAPIFYSVIWVPAIISLAGVILFYFTQKSISD